MAWRSGLSKNLRELRVHLCQTSEASKGLREFVQRNYVELKKHNPHFPFLVREASNAEAKLIARYDFGEERMVSVQGKDETAIQQEVKQLIQFGENLPRYGEICRAY